MQVAHVFGSDVYFKIAYSKYPGYVLIMWLWSHFDYVFRRKLIATLIILWLLWYFEEISYFNICNKWIRFDYGCIVKNYFRPVSCRKSPDRLFIIITLIIDSKKSVHSAIIKRLPSNACCRIPIEHSNHKNHAKSQTFQTFFLRDGRPGPGDAMFDSNSTRIFFFLKRLIDEQCLL